MTDIGRAGIVMKGDYNSASTYETLDAVSYANGLYVAKQNVPAGIVPTNTTYWQKAIDHSNYDLKKIGEKSAIATDDSISLTDSLAAFSELVVAIKASTWGVILATAAIPLQIFATTEVNISGVDTSNNRLMIGISKTSDTSIKITNVSVVGTWASSNFHIYFYAR